MFPSHQQNALIPPSFLPCLETLISIYPCCPLVNQWIVPKLRAHTNIENCEEFALNELVILGTQFTTFPFHYLQQGGGQRGMRGRRKKGTKWKRKVNDGERKWRPIFAYFKRSKIVYMPTTTCKWSTYSTPLLSHLSQKTQSF